MLNQFRHLYPQGTIFSELINIDRGLYIVKVSLQDRNLVLGTGFAAAETIEKAEDRARERALMTVNLDERSQEQQSQPQLGATQIAPKTADKVTMVQTSQVAVTEKPEPTPVQTPIAIASTTTETSPVEKANNHHVAIAQRDSNANSNQSGAFASAEPINRSEPIEDILPPSTTQTPPVEESPTNIFEQPVTPLEESPTNIFEQPVVTPPVEETKIEETEEVTETIQFDFNDIKHKTDLEMKRLGWTKEQGRDYLLGTYGKRSRLHLTDEELLEFWRYLETLPN